MSDVAASSSRKRVLFVDDDPLFLSTLSQVLGALSQGAWEVVTVESAGKALEQLQEGNFQLVVVDIQMPVVDGLQFLTLVNRRFPNLQKVVLTGFATDEYRAACLSNGAELFLEKPKVSGDYDTLHTTLNELLKFHSEEGFRGVLRRVGLEDVIQMECLSRHSAVLEVSGRGGQGEIYIRDGAIVHASGCEAEGEEAFNRLLALRGGEFRLKHFEEPPAETIQGSWEFLLMEAARNRDEVRGNADLMDGGGGVGTSSGGAAPGVVGLEEIPDIIMGPKPGAAAGPKSAPMVPVTSGVAAPAEPKPTKIVVPEGMPTPAWVARLNAGGTEFYTRGDSTTFRMRNPAPVRGGSGDTGMIVQEAVVCDGQGEVTYRWQSPSTEKWVQFLEFVSQRSRQLAQGLPAGEFERLVIQSPEERVLVRLGAEYGAVARVTPGATPTGGRS